MDACAVRVRAYVCWFFCSVFLFQFFFAVAAASSPSFVHSWNGWCFPFSFIHSSHTLARSLSKMIYKSRSKILYSLILWLHTRSNTVCCTQTLQLHFRYFLFSVVVVVFFIYNHITNQENHNLCHRLHQPSYAFHTKKKKNNNHNTEMYLCIV